MLLVDSNLLIYATQPSQATLRSWLLDILPKVSIISRVEVLGYHKLGNDEKAALIDLLDCMQWLYPTSASYEIAIALRQQRRIALGDALIAATCLEHSLGLATANTEDFDWIQDLRVINPLVQAAE